MSGKLIVVGPRRRYAEGIVDLLVDAALRMAREKLSKSKMRRKKRDK